MYERELLFRFLGSFSSSYEQKGEKKIVCSYCYMLICLFTYHMFDRYVVCPKRVALFDEIPHTQLTGYISI